MVSFRCNLISKLLFFFFLGFVYQIEIIRVIWKITFQDDKCEIYI